jgi:hypothetical protein
MDRVANRRNLHRVIATKPTRGDIVEGNGGGAKRRMALVDEDDELFQDEEFEDMNGMRDTNHQHDTQMADRDGVQEQLQGSEREKATGLYIQTIYYIYLIA